MRTISMSLMVGVLLVSVAAAQAPDLSGTWTLDVSRSDATLFTEPRATSATPVMSRAEAEAERALLASAGKPESLTITQTALAFTLQRSDTSDGVTLSTVLLDGTARPASADRTVRAWHEAGAVMIEVVKTVLLPGGGVAESRTAEKLSRNTDGTLSVERVIESAGASRRWRFAYQPAK